VDFERIRSSTVYFAMALSYAILSIFIENVVK